MKRKERSSGSLFSKRRKEETPVPAAMPAAPVPPAAAPAPVRMSCGLLFEGAPEAMPIVDEQLFLYMAPQGGLAIGPQYASEPLMMLWRDGENWLVRRLCPEKLLCNGFETMGDSPILLQDGVRMELVGLCAFTFQVFHSEPVLPKPEAAEEKPPFDWKPLFAEEEPEPIGETVPVVKPDMAEELALAEEAPFEWKPILPEEPDPIGETVPVEMPAVAEEIPAVAEELPAVEEAPFDWTPFLPVDEPDPIGETVPMEKPDIVEELPAAPEVPFEWKPVLPAEEPDPTGETVLAAEPAAAPFEWKPVLPAEEPDPTGETVLVAEPAAAPFDWTPFLPVDEPDPTGETVLVEEPAPVEEPAAVEEPVLEGPVFVEMPVLREQPASGDPLMSALERLAAGDREALQTLPDLLAQKELYCWGGFNFLGVYLQPIPAARPADWSGDADALDQVGWEPRPGMVIPVFTCEEEAVKRNCPLGAFPSCSAPGLFAHFVETGLDLEVDPFGMHPVRIPAAAVRELSGILGGSPEKFRWIRRTLPW